jgi:hypothetical protein
MLDPVEIAAKAELGIDATWDILKWADESVAAGRTEHGVFELYLVENATPEELLAAFKEVLLRLGLQWPDQQHGRRIVLAALTRDIAAGSIQPVVGARIIWATLGAGEPRPDGDVLQYGQLFAAWDSAGDFRSDQESQVVANRRRKIEREIVRFAQGLCLRPDHGTGIVAGGPDEGSN